uniref:Uncharacterized protein n=1 Tax=Panagrolaimus sp. JU765 TaxID=591449 RepID=A0AC34RS81_9BILA
MSSNSRKRKRQNSENSAPKHVPVSYANNVVNVSLNPKGHLSLSLLRSTFSEDINRLYLRYVLSCVAHVLFLTH